MITPPSRSDVLTLFGKTTNNSREITSVLSCLATFGITSSCDSSIPRFRPLNRINGKKKCLRQTKRYFRNTVPPARVEFTLSPLIVARTRQLHVIRVYGESAKLSEIGHFRGERSASNEF